MRNTAGRGPAFADSALSVPRLRLVPVPSRRTLLGGGWWPRSADPVAELPGLIRAIDTLGAMDLTAQAVNLIRVPDILATLTSPAQPTGTALELSAWESDGGRLASPTDAT